MRRFLGIAVVLLFTIPFGLSVDGCGHHTVVTYCNAGDTGPSLGQVATIQLETNTLALTGESLNYGQIGQTLSASAEDCRQNPVSVSAFTYATRASPNSPDSTLQFADINPRTGAVCAGSWNRNSGGGIADFTTCTAPATAPTSNVFYIVAEAGGAASNAIPVFVHPVVTSVVLGNPSTNCSTDPATNCCTDITEAEPVTAPAYDETAGCLSQNKNAQLVARVYDGGLTDEAHNISCQVGRVSYAALNNANVVTIDQNGVATANQPGSVIITGSIANSSSGTSAGYFSTCPPTSITLAVPNSTATSIAVPLNNAQPLVATVKDKNGTVLSGLNLEFNSTDPRTVPSPSGTVTPIFPGTATITAVCQPGICNPSPFSQIGLNGNGQPLTSNGITVTAAGTSSTVLYVGSLQSQYIFPYDFTTATPGILIKLPYTPNSMVISQDGTAVYLGSTQALMTLSTASNTLATPNTLVPGVVLAVSPDGGTLVVTDPTRQTISLVSNAGAVQTTYGGVGTHAVWSPDSQKVYITTTGNALLTHSPFEGWQSTPLNGTDQTYNDVAVTVPSVGAYFAGKVTDGRSACPSMVSQTAGAPPTVTNDFAPLADESATPTDRLAATTDGKHILGATASTNPALLSDIVVTLPVPSAAQTTTSDFSCPQVVTPGYFQSSLTTQALAKITATSITGVDPASNSALAFVTYTGSSGLLPLYAPAASGAGTLSYVTLSSGASSAPVAGVFSTDNKTFYAGTTGDNSVHVISVTGTSATDSSTLTPNLPNGSGGIATPNLIVQKPKQSTS